MTVESEFRCFDMYYPYIQSIPRSTTWAHMPDHAQRPPVQVFDMVTLQRLVKLAGHKGLVYDVSWSPDNRYIVTCGSDATAKMWDLKAARAVQNAAQSAPISCSSPGAPVSQMADTLHGHDASTGSAAADSAADTAHASPFCTVLMHPSYVYSCAFHPSMRSQLQGCSGGGDLDGTDAIPNQAVRLTGFTTTRSSRRRGGPVSQQGEQTMGGTEHAPPLQRLIATACCDGNAYLWDADSAYAPLKMICVVPQAGLAHPAGVNVVAWDPNVVAGANSCSSLLFTGAISTLTARCAGLSRCMFDCTIGCWTLLAQIQHMDSSISGHLGPVSSQPASVCKTFYLARCVSKMCVGG